MTFKVRRTTSERPICFGCWHWQAAIDLPTGAVGQVYGCIKQLPMAGERVTCLDFDADPGRQKIEFFELPSKRRPK